MDEQIRQQILTSLSTCDKLIKNLRKNQEDVDSFFDGEMRLAYLRATERALDEAMRIRVKLLRML